MEGGHPLELVQIVQARDLVVEVLHDILRVQNLDVVDQLLIARLLLRKREHIQPVPFIADDQPIHRADEHGREDSANGVGVELDLLDFHQKGVRDFVGTVFDLLLVQLRLEADSPQDEQPVATGADQQPPLLNVLQFDEVVILDDFVLAVVLANFDLTPDIVDHHVFGHRDQVEVFLQLQDVGDGLEHLDSFLRSEAFHVGRVQSAHVAGNEDVPTACFVEHASVPEFLLLGVNHVDFSVNQCLVFANYYSSTSKKDSHLFSTSLMDPSSSSTRTSFSSSSDPAF